MTLRNARAPFRHPDWLFELKYDRFRALAHLRDGEATLISGNGHLFSSFTDLARSIMTALPDIKEAVLDGEIVCLDTNRRPRFKDLLFHRSTPCFFAFDLLRDEKDRRNDALQQKGLERFSQLPACP